MRGGELVCGLGELGVGDRVTVGGKGASLGELVRVGFPVPAGYVVTVAAFEQALRTLDPAEEIRDGGHVIAVRTYRGETERSIKVTTAWVGD
jgi:phosphoenolpyruvate synthase/pyruvate phosphate dikinase